ASSRVSQFRRVPPRDSGQVVTPFVRVGTSRCSLFRAAQTMRSSAVHRCRRFVMLMDCAELKASPLAHKIACETVVTGSRGLPSASPVHLPQDACGLRRYEPVRTKWIAPLRGKLLSYPTRNFAVRFPSRELGGHMVLSLHVAMQHGPSLHPNTRISDVWSLRIPIAFPRSVFPADCPHQMRCHRGAR